MSHCHHTGHSLVPMLDLLGIEGSGLVIAAFMTGLVISLTHCIGMCGPFALMQLNLKLMPLPASQLTQMKKLKLAIFMPYYLGKGVTYCLLTTLLYMASYGVMQTEGYHIIASCILLTTALFFLWEGLSQIMPMRLEIPLFKRLAQILERSVKHLKLQASGFGSFLTGVILGFIPCGALYASLTSIAALSLNWGVAIASATAFAIATIPGLFLTAYLGEYCMSKWRKHFTKLYALMMLLNALLLLRYSWKLI